jgi:hypothetical protein
MKAFRARSGPFENQLSFSTQEIDAMCVEALSRAELLPEAPQPIRIERFIEKYFNCAVNYEDLGEGAMGCTVFRENGSIEGVIISNQIDDGHQTSERRVRSTLAHEGGHCLMHPILFMTNSSQNYLDLQNGNRGNLDFERRRILCRDTDVGAATGKRIYSGRWWEWQANRAIGSFLLPAKLVRQFCAQFAELSTVTASPVLSGHKRVEAERAVADVFDVNPVVARIRLSELFRANINQMEF